MGFYTFKNYWVILYCMSALFLSVLDTSNYSGGSPLIRTCKFAHKNGYLYNLPHIHSACVIIISIWTFILSHIILPALYPWICCPASLENKWRLDGLNSHYLKLYAYIYLYQRFIKIHDVCSGGGPLYYLPETVHRDS